MASTCCMLFRTGAIQVGDRVLSINGVSTLGKSLSQATEMLAAAGDLVTLKIARHDKPQTTSKSLHLYCFICQLVDS